MNGIIMGNLENFALRFTQGAAHFLWIGALLAVGVWVADRLLVRSAAARHGLHLVGMLLLALTLPLCLVAVNVTGGPERKVSATPPNVVVEPVPVAPAAPGVRLGEPRPLGVRGEAAVPAELPATRLPNGEAVTEESIGVSAVTGWLERSAPWVAGIYLGGLVAMMARLLAGLAGTRRLRRGGDPVESGLWVAGMQKMCATLGMKTKPILAWSREVAAPVLIGIAKPVVLLPGALASRLAPRQLEAVLSHELAHLRRLDPWAVALQRVVETLLFFHPAVWWMSLQLERSREEACDDLVVAAGCDPADYAEALVRCSELRLEEAGLSGRLAMPLSATGGGGAPLRRRVLRLLGQPERVPVRSGWILGTMALLAVCLVWPIVLAAGPGNADDTGRERPREIGLPPASPPPAAITMEFESETMQNIIGTQLRQKCSVRLCLENLDFDSARDGITIEQAVAQLEGAAKKRQAAYDEGHPDMGTVPRSLPESFLTPKERDRLSLARKLLAEGNPKTMLFDVGSRYSGQYQADSVDELLTQITRGTPYAWRKIGDTFVVLPAAGSRLGYPVTLATKGLTVGQAVQKVVEQQPADSHISMPMFGWGLVKEGEDPMPWLSAKAPAIELKGIPALEALCRITAGARPDSVWELAGYKDARQLGISRGPNAPPAPVSVPPASQVPEDSTAGRLAAGKTMPPNVVMPAGLPVAAETKGPATQIESEVLRTELFSLCERMIAAQKETGQPMPEPAKVDARKKWMLDQCTKAVPGFLDVTREQEQRYSDGKFDDRIAKERMRKTLKLLGDLDAELPVMCVFIAKEFDAGSLSGGQLEIANRVMLVPVYAMVQSLQDDQAYPDAENLRNLLLELLRLRTSRTNPKDSLEQPNGLDLDLREGKKEKPFTTFSVELTSPELHDRTITFNEDGSYTFRMTELEKVPGKDYYRDSKDKYVARHGLASRDLRQLNKLIQETKWLAAPGKQDERLRDAVRYAMAVVHDGQNGQAVCYGNQERRYTDLVAFLQKVDRQEWWLYNLKKGERIFLYSLSSHLDEVVKKGVEPRVLDLGRLTEGVQTLSATGSQEQKAFARKVFEKLDKMTERKTRAKLLGVWQEEGNPMRLVIKEDGSFEWTHAGQANKWRVTGDWDVSGQRFYKEFVQSPQKPAWVGHTSELIIHQLTADTLVFHTGDDPNLSIGVTRYKRIKKEEDK